MSIQTVNPATGEALETYEETSPRELEQVSAVLGADMTPNQVQLIAVSASALVLTGALLRWTPLGRKVRAVASPMPWAAPVTMQVRWSKRGANELM